VLELLSKVAFGTATLLFLFGTAMAISFGIKSPLDYSVFSASAGALLVGSHQIRNPKPNPPSYKLAGCDQMRANFVERAGESTPEIPEAIGPLELTRPGSTSRRQPTPPRPSTLSRSNRARSRCSLGVTIKTVGYNGQVPGPLLRLQRGSWQRLTF